MKISVKLDGLQATLANLAGQQKQVRFATAVALTRTAEEVKKAMPAYMKTVLDRPTEFTTGGMFVRKATRDNLEAIVGLKNLQAGYLRFQIEGGVRRPGSAGIKLPGNIELNQFGNIPKGMIAKLKDAARSGALSSAIGKRLGVKVNRRKGAPAIQLFVGKPIGKGWEKAPMGIWRRVAGNPGKLIPVIVFEDTPANYRRPKFKFAEKSAEIVGKSFPIQFDRALSEAMRTAR